MQLNSNVFKGARSARMIWTAVGFFLVGALFVGLGVYFLIAPSDPENQNLVVDFALIGLGGIAVVASVLLMIKAVKNIKNAKPLSEEEVKANEERLSADAPAVENVKDVKLFFHFGGKMNQSYFVDDKQGNRVYECNLTKFNLIGASTYDFVDKSTGYVKTLKIGKTVTSESSGGLPFIGDTMTSRFKIDGVMCWDYLRERGLEIKHLLEGRTVIRYELAKLGKTIAKIVPANVKDPFNEENVNFLRMGKGCYRLEIFDAKLDDVVMAAFIVAHTYMVE